MPAKEPVCSHIRMKLITQLPEQVPRILHSYQQFIYTRTALSHLKKKSFHNNDPLLCTVGCRRHKQRCKNKHLALLNGSEATAEQAYSKGEIIIRNV